MMKKFIIKLIIFVSVFFALTAFLNSLCYDLVLRNTILERTERQLYGLSPEEVKILILGDSHAKMSIDPRIVENSFNFASQGENYIETYYKLKFILEKTRFKPAVIILPIDLHSFSSFLAVRFDNEWYWKKYVNFFELALETKNPSLLKWGLGSLFLFKGRGAELFFASGRVLIGGETNREDKLQKIYKGHLPLAGDFSAGDFSQETDRLQYASGRVDCYLKGYDSIDDNLFLYFRKILDLCLENDVSLVLIKFPMTKEYLEASFRYIPDRELYYQKITDLIDEFDNIYLLDYQRLYENEPYLFSDCDHLNPQGADSFSILINQDVENLRPEKASVDSY